MSFIRNSSAFCRRAVRVHQSPVVLARFGSTHTNTAATQSFDASAIDTRFPGAQAPFTQQPTLTLASSATKVPIYRVLDGASGAVLPDAHDPELPRETLTEMFRKMVLLGVLDKILYESQRQGRISFYMQSSGEEATHIGSAAALANDDLVYAQYREAGVLLWRGFSIADYVNQCYGNVLDAGKGRQMPIHFGSEKHNFVTISSPLATQMPQAVGAAYALKLKPNNQRCVIAYFGEGAASEGDAHAAFNFAATLDAPVILFCRNNGFAISTPSSEQYRGDGIAGRAAGYGITALRVDGTDILAMYNAMQVAREYVLKHNKPIVVEAMTYRIGHHSTSDDSSAYRSLDDLAVWNTVEHPTTKMRAYMQARGWFDETAEADYAQQVRKQVLKQISDSEKMLKPKWQELFHDVYDVQPPHLKAQQAEMEAHVAKHKEHYPLAGFTQ